MREGLCLSDVGYSGYIISPLVSTAHGRYPILNLKVQEVNKMIRVAIAYPFVNHLIIKEIEPELQSYYDELDCEQIEAVPFRSVPGVLMVLDEEGKLNGKMPNFQITTAGGIPMDTIVGNVMFVRAGEEDFESLTDKQLDQLKKLWHEMG